MHGSDVIQTAWALARALGTIEGTELVIAGNEATDGVGGAVPAIIAEYLGLPQLTHLRTVTVEDGTLTGERETDEGVFALQPELRQHPGRGGPFAVERGLVQPDTDRSRGTDPDGQLEQPRHRNLPHPRRASRLRR